MYDDSPEPFLAHIRRCHTATLPGARRPISVRDTRFGWVDPRAFAPLTMLGLVKGEHFRVESGTQLEALGNNLADQGLYRPHNELFDVSDETGQVLGQIDRGALPLLGCRAAGVHLNGLVRKKGETFLWMGHRAANKRLDPGKLDHIAAGGICAGLTPLEALVKEAGEEAAIIPELAHSAQPVAQIRYAMERPEGLRQDTLHCYDLILPESFVPTPVDGEVASFELMSLREVYCRVRDTQDIKFNVNLVLIDLFLRQNLFTPETARLLRDALDKA